MLKIQSPVYLSGPMSGLPQENYPAFMAAAKQLRDLGFEVVNPAEQAPQETWEDYMRQDIRLLMDCKSVVFLSGLENSRGANIEIDLARKIGLPVLPLWGVLAAMAVGACHQDGKGTAKDDQEEVETLQASGFSPR